MLWATLRTLGRRGVSDLVEGLHDNAVALADACARWVARCSTTSFTQVSTGGDDETTAAVERELVADGQTWMTGSTWHDRRVLRIAVSNWATDAEQVGPHARGAGPRTAGRGFRLLTDRADPAHTIGRDS